jgi:hypothetical protein
MHDPMSNGIDVRRRLYNAGLAFPQSIQHLLDGLVAGRNFGLVTVCNSFRVLDLHFRRPAIPLDRSFPKAGRRIVWQCVANFVQTTLLAAGTRIQHKDFHEWVRPSLIWRIEHVITRRGCAMCRERGLTVGNASFMTLMRDSRLRRSSYATDLVDSQGRLSPRICWRNEILCL